MSFGSHSKCPSCGEESLIYRTDDNWGGSTGFFSESWYSCANCGERIDCKELEEFLKGE